MNNKSGFIFDMDGVIFDTERLWKDAFERANKKFSLPLSEEYRQSICGKTEIAIREELRQLFPDVDADEYREYTLNYVCKCIDNGDFEIKEGFIETIGFLKERGFKTALATSSHKERAFKLFSLKGLEISRFFDAMVFSEDIGSRSKPDPYIFLSAAKAIDIPPEHCFVVEDSINGVEAAHRGGFMPIMAVDLIKPDSYCLEHTYAIINGLSELRSIAGELL